LIKQLLEFTDEENYKEFDGPED